MKNNRNKSSIDIVITWVDGSDKEWLSEKSKYKVDIDEKEDNFDSVGRYRSWDNLHYLFRGLEKFAPWFNKIFFVTYKKGKVPTWMNENNPRLEVVDQNEFVPSKYLPTFNINCIENNFQRINGLGERFIYFNDDMFIIKPLSKTDFFSDGKPVDCGILTTHCYARTVQMTLVRTIAIGVINDHFILKESIKNNITKWFNPKYGMGNIQNLILMNCPRFPGIEQHHLPTAILKSTYDKVWEAEPDLLDEVCSHKFRNIVDLNHWVYKNWQIASGEFVPRSRKLGKAFQLENQYEEALNYIKGRKGKVVCINDEVKEGGISPDQFKIYKHNIIQALDKIMPEKSSFEL